jgi:hypothetical protein
MTDVVKPTQAYLVKIACGRSFFFSWSRGRLQLIGRPLRKKYECIAVLLYCRANFKMLLGQMSFCPGETILQKACIQCYMRDNDPKPIGKRWQTAVNSRQDNRMVSLAECRRRAFGLRFARQSCCLSMGMVVFCRRVEPHLHRLLQGLTPQGDGRPVKCLLRTTNLITAHSRFRPCDERYRFSFLFNPCMHGRKSRGGGGRIAPRICSGDANTGCPPQIFVIFQNFKRSPWIRPPRFQPRSTPRRALA